MITKKIKEYAHRTGAFFKRLCGVRFSRNVWTFLIFLFISFLLWLTMTLNEVIKRDVVCQLRYTNVPDSVTFITEPPRDVILNLKARGTQLLKYQFGEKPIIEIDFRYYSHANKISLSNSELRLAAQNAIGAELTIEALSPDTLGSVFTTSEPAHLPVAVNAVIVTAPNSRQFGPVTPLTDTVQVYSVKPLNDRVTYIETEPLKYYNVDKSFVSRVRLIPPSGCRVIPDSIDISVKVETVFARSKNVNIEIINVPGGYSLDLFTTVVKVDYIVPAREVNTQTDIRVVADFNSLPADFSTETIPITLITSLKNAHLEVDEVGYIVTKRKND